jgi:hypothetical protein
MSTKKNNSVALENLEGRTLYSVAYNAALDFNHDGVVSPTDAAIVASHDLNQNGKVGDLQDTITAMKLGGWTVLTTKVTSAAALEVKAESDPYSDFDLDHDGFHTIGDFIVADSGDFNGDGKVDLGDVITTDAVGGPAAFYQKLSEAMQHDNELRSMPFADVDWNHDGHITPIDQAVANTGDFNLDGVVNGSDACILGECGGTTAMNAELTKGLITEQYLNVDLDGDGRITAGDFAVADSGDFNGDGVIDLGDVITADSLGGKDAIYARLNEALAALAK